MDVTTCTLFGAGCRNHTISVADAAARYVIRITRATWDPAMRNGSGAGQLGNWRQDQESIISMPFGSR
jgi:hypothetical protein